MRSFITGITLIFALATAVALAAEVDDRSVTMTRACELFLLMFAVPVIAGTAAARAIHAVRPRRALRGAGRGAFSTCLGLNAAILSVVATSLIYVVAPGKSDPRGDAMILAGMTAIVCAAMVLLLGGRPRAGLCNKCGYDISASLNFGRCPECGHGLAA
jgi:hypothetical protein